MGRFERLMSWIRSGLLKPYQPHRRYMRGSSAARSA
jgi:hypothetical protein